MRPQAQVLFVCRGCHQPAPESFIIFRGPGLDLCHSCLWRWRLAAWRGVMRCHTIVIRYPARAYGRCHRLYSKTGGGGEEPVSRRQASRAGRVFFLPRALL